MGANSAGAPMAEQRWDPERYRRNAGFVAELGEPLLDMLSPFAGERILAVGCGDGALAERLQRLGATVIGVDRSAEQVAAARARPRCAGDGWRDTRIFR